MIITRQLSVSERALMIIEQREREKREKWNAWHERNKRNGIEFLPTIRRYNRETRIAAEEARILKEKEEFKRKRNLSMRAIRRYLKSFRGVSTEQFIEAMSFDYENDDRNPNVISEFNR